jgi:uncharacterized protein YvpB
MRNFIVKKYEKTKRKKDNTGVQSINNVFHIVDKVENVLVYTHIFNLIDNVEYVVYALYSRTILGGQS